MQDKNIIIEQTQIAFDFIQKLFMETSYLIKEIEGILSQDGFIIGRPSGYGVTTMSSTSLEANYVNLWLLRKFAVFYVEKDKTKINRGQTVTPLTKDTKIIYLRLVLNDKSLNEPRVYSGVLNNFERKSKREWPKKFEHIMGHIEYNDTKILKNFKKIEYEDSYVKFQGKLAENNLFEIENSEMIVNKIIEPCMKLYNSF